jgi:hypothetical protein
LPALNSLVLIRSSHHRFPLEHLEPGEVVLAAEDTLSDAFDSGHEYAAVSVLRSYAMLVTPTCDLDQPEGVFIAWPLRPFEGSNLNEGNLAAGRYANLFLLPEHKYIDRCFVDVTDLRPIRPQHFPLKDRIASVTRVGMDEILQKFHGSLGRLWGYAEGEIVEPLGRYETGVFRCARCNVYEIKVPEILIKPGTAAPACDNCKKIGRQAQWYPLTKHSK